MKTFYKPASSLISSYEYKALFMGHFHLCISGIFSDEYFSGALLSQSGLSHPHRDTYWDFLLMIAQLYVRLLLAAEQVVKFSEKR